MLKPIKKIGFIVLIILILPISVFFIYQFASLNKSENEINKIYFQQLETIIYSINQYSDDVVSSWANEINIILLSNKGVHDDELNKFMSENSSIKSIILSDTNFTNTSNFNSPISRDNQNLDTIKKSFTIDQQLIKNLINFLNVGYQKIEAIGKTSVENLNVCLFVINKGSSKIGICSIVFNPDEFVKHNLAAKISQACGDEFTLSVIDRNENSVIYSCDKLEISELTVLKPLWLVPDFSIGIKMKSGNIGDLVRQRYTENLVILGVLCIILAIGIGIIYYNLKRQLQLTQLKSDFISNVSHELRTPLSLISMYSETLLLDRLNNEEKKKEYYSVINSETNRLNKIVNSILNFSKMESGTREFSFNNLNLIEVNNEILKTYDYHIKSKGFSYTINVDKQNENIIGDRNAISESIINLIENAIKYSRDKKEFKVSIGSNKIGQYWEIHDYGIGISEEDQYKIFDKFYRVSSGLVHNTKGTGLGLPLVKQIMEAHEGEVSVKSEFGVGSIFTLQFNKKFGKT